MLVVISDCLVILVISFLHKFEKKIRKNYKWKSLFVFALEIAFLIVIRPLINYVYSISIIKNSYIYGTKDFMLLLLAILLIEERLGLLKKFNDI